MDYAKEALRVHQALKGKLHVESKLPVESVDDLSVAYTPGVAAPCLEIAKNKEDAYTYTIKSNYIAVISNGTAVLGLGDIGPEAAMPVMEGKAVLFKEFGGVDAVPICLDTKDPQEIIGIVEKMGPSFGGINLEDISAPSCFEIEKTLIERMDIPVFHDDQHGTAVVCYAGLLNALGIVGKDLKDCKIVMSGVGAAGSAIAEMVLSAGARNIIMCDRQGALYPGRDFSAPFKARLAEMTNPDHIQGSLEEVLKGADIFIGVSSANLLDEAMVSSMAEDAIVFALANPDPEILPEIAYKAGARIVATGRSDMDNQVNNVLAFPGIFRGTLDTHASAINAEMKLAAAKAIATTLTEEEIDEKMILPMSFDRRVGIRVAAAVAEAATQSGVARNPLTYDQAYEMAKEKMPHHED